MKIQESLLLVRDEIADIVESGDVYTLVDIGAEPGEPDTVVDNDARYAYNYLTGPKPYSSDALIMIAMLTADYKSSNILIDNFPELAQRLLFAYKGGVVEE